MSDPATPHVRKGQDDVKLSREEFERRLKERFYDPAFDAVASQIQAVVDVAWKTYDEYHKSPRTRKAGPGFADPELETRSAGQKIMLRIGGENAAQVKAKLREVRRELAAAGTR